MELSQVPKWKKLWNRIQKKNKEIPSENIKTAELEKTFLHSLCVKFFDILESKSLKGKIFNLITHNKNK